MSGEDRSKETTKERVDRLVSEGKISRQIVEAAEKLWAERLQAAITLPNGESVSVTRSDLYHLIIDDRIGRKPERIERILLGIFEIRTARIDRRLALSRWEEEGRTLLGRAILDIDNSVRSIHLIDEKKLKRELREGELIWRL